MGKMMSLLEKYKIIEREEFPENDMATTEPAIAEESTAKEELTSEVAYNTYETLASEATSTQPAIPIEEGEEETMHSDYNEQNAQATMQPEDHSATEQTELYHHKQSIDTIYHYAGLDGKATTETAFYLENLINALPAELPEYVKKTTVDNIIAASNIDINKLLSDGMERFTQLDQFQQAFSATNFNEIAALKDEIDRLTAMINSYHQTIKQKEMLIQEEAELVETEKARINHILTFFKAE